MDEVDRHMALELAAHTADDMDFARELHQHTVPFWSHSWPRINELQRSGYLRVRPISRWLAEIETTDKVTPIPR